VSGWHRPHRDAPWCVLTGNSVRRHLFEEAVSQFEEQYGATSKRRSRRNRRSAFGKPSLRTLRALMAPSSSCGSSKIWRCSPPISKAARKTGRSSSTFDRASLSLCGSFPKTWSVSTVNPSRPLCSLIQRPTRNSHRLQALSSPERLRLCGLSEEYAISISSSCRRRSEAVAIYTCPR